ncbi:hypothetical protein QQS21_011639 [Conoideocrella luteorostrata]|uniref:Uncharacterized protein n=1 Tax=Conoideocrella luteorostrata TaxID=1105319 RepID=A0AAJ0CCW1_9HYPO|nr:hypothetical protein QQS21_011639 [Conoideocrella luteorostrata]
MKTFSTIILMSSGLAAISLAAPQENGERTPAKPQQQPKGLQALCEENSIAAEACLVFFDKCVIQYQPSGGILDIPPSKSLPSGPSTHERRAAAESPVGQPTKNPPARPDHQTMDIKACIIKKAKAAEEKPGSESPSQQKNKTSTKPTKPKSWDEPIKESDKE